MNLSLPHPHLPAFLPTPFSKNKGKTVPPDFPVLPLFLATPVKFIPEKIPTAGIVKTLNTLLKEPLCEGDLDFLEDQSVSVEITDLNLRFALTLENEKLAGKPWLEKDNLNLKGNLYEFLLLASRTEDSDTLFFQRRLKMVGSTDLGLEVKNLLDGLEMESIQFHQPIDFALKKIVTLYERFFIT